MADEKKKIAYLRIFIDAIVGLIALGLVAGLRLQWAMHDAQTEQSLILKSMVHLVSEIEADQKDAIKKHAEYDMFVAKTETSRFTAKDGQAVWQEIYRIQKEIAVLSQITSTEIPPVWFKNQVDDLSSRVRILEGETNGH